MFLHKAALVGHTLAGSTIQVKDMYERLSALESENGRSFGQEFEVGTPASFISVYLPFFCNGGERGECKFYPLKRAKPVVQ